MIESFEPVEHQKKLKAGVIAMSTLLVPQQPETVTLRPECVMRKLTAYEPSGSSEGLSYWKDFTLLGSYSNAPVPRAMCGSGSDGTLKNFIEIEDTNAVAPLSHGEEIAAIRSALSLQIKELAEILGVQRPTIYSWINGDSHPSASNRSRLQQVYRIASEWTRWCNLPAGSLIRAGGTDGHSTIELLKADEIDEAEIVKRFALLARKRLSMTPGSEQKRPSLTTVANRHGMNLSEVDDQQHLIDIETGKRSNLD